MSDRFKQLADEFEVKIKATDTDGCEEIFLVFHWFDENGTEVSVSRESIGTRVKVSGSSNDFNQVFAARIYQGTLIQNMRSRVLGAPKIPTVIPGWLTPVFVQDIEIEINPSK